MRITQLTFLGFYLNGALGSGKYADITLEDVRTRIRDETIFEFLKSKLGHDIDLSLFEPIDLLELLCEWHDMLGISPGRKLCVDEGGLCLLVAFLLEGIQRRVVFQYQNPN